MSSGTAQNVAPARNTAKRLQNAGGKRKNLIAVENLAQYHFSVCNMVI